MGHGFHSLNHQRVVFRAMWGNIPMSCKYKRFKYLIRASCKLLINRTDSPTCWWIVSSPHKIYSFYRMHPKKYKIYSTTSFVGQKTHYVQSFSILYINNIALSPFTAYPWSSMRLYPLSISIIFHYYDPWFSMIHDYPFCTVW